MTPKSSEAPAVSEVYALLRSAAIRRQPVAAVYDGQPRLLCPHVGGWKEGRRNVLCYQFGGRSNTVEPLFSEGMGVWRCLAVERLSQVELHTGNWHTAPRSRQQTCIDDVDFEVEAQPEEDPQ